MDDPYTFGAIAAANALSDVYAMGGRPILALAIAGFPANIPPALISAVFQGGADKVAEAGAVLVGGHTVTDPEPKYGLCVTGLVHPAQITPKGGAQPGDVLLLTKPLGTGVVTTALKRDAAEPAHMEAAVESMLQLNRRAAELAAEIGGIHSATDITGFGLLGHAAEMARNSGARLRFSAGAVPLLPGALTYADQGFLPGGGARNRDYLLNTGILAVEPDVQDALLTVLFDPQTSGGLLFALPRDRADALLRRCREEGQACWEVGAVEQGEGLVVGP
ncbi:MAG: selenide, water dikinase [Herpetosiphonaceae bacterium]|nr:MAG: selenide, water dikinase [Herpetosiphonaceae bacterium]